MCFRYQLANIPFPLKILSPIRTIHKYSPIIIDLSGQTQ